MTIEEIKMLGLGDEVARDDGAVGFVLKNNGGRIEMMWVDTRGRRSVELLEFFKLISMARGTPPAAAPTTSHDPSGVFAERLRAGSY